MVGDGRRRSLSKWIAHNDLPLCRLRCSAYPRLRLVHDVWLDGRHDGHVHDERHTCLGAGDIRRLPRKGQESRGHPEPLSQHHDQAGDLLEHSQASLGRFDLIRPPGKGAFLDALTAGKRGGKHRVVYSDVTDVSSESVISEIEEAHHRMPGGGVTRSAIMYLGIEQSEVWLDLLGPGRSRLAADTIVACRRLDLVGLERWSHEQHGQFSDPADRDRLLAMTGGWPLLVDSVAAACAAGIGASQAMMNLRTDLDNELGQNLIDATGLPNSVLKTSYTTLLELGAELLSDEAESTFEQVLVDGDRPAAILAALIAAGAVNRNHNGTLSLEPVLAKLWQTHHDKVACFADRLS